MTHLRIGLIGAGHFGRFHALKIAASQRATLVGVHDPDQARAELVARETRSQAMPVDALLAVVEAVVIAAPAEHHHQIALQALHAGKHVLIEKPIAATLDQADEIAALAVDKRLIVQVGHLLRYTPEHAAISARVARPVFIECTRVAPYKPRGTDVSVILDLMIHDLDLVLSLVDADVESVDAVGAAVSSPYEDMANARVRFANGCVATITASRISFKTDRRMRIFGEEGYLSADFGARKLVMINRERGLPLPGTGGFRREEVSWRDADALEAEHAAFAAACLDGAPVLVDARAGRRALAAAIAVTHSIAESRRRAIQSGLIQNPQNLARGGV